MSRQHRAAGAGCGARGERERAGSAGTDGALDSLAVRGAPILASGSKRAAKPRHLRFRARRAAVRCVPFTDATAARDSHPTPHARRCGCAGWCRCSASRRSFPGAASTIRSRCSRRRFAAISASATSRCSAASPSASSSRDLAAPAAGRLVDARGGRFTLAGGSALGALALAVLALAQGTATLMVGFALAGLAMAGCLYDPAFATLHGISGPVVPQGGHGADAVRRLREHRVLAAVAIPARRLWLARDVRGLCGAEPRGLRAAAPVGAAAAGRAPTPHVATARGRAAPKPAAAASACSSGSRRRWRWRRSCRRRCRRT